MREAQLARNHQDSIRDEPIPKRKSDLGPFGFIRDRDHLH